MLTGKAGCVFLNTILFSGIKRVCGGDGGMCEDKERVYFLKESTAKMSTINLLSDYLGTSVDTTSIRLK